MPTPSMNLNDLERHLYITGGDYDTIALLIEAQNEIATLENNLEDSELKIKELETAPDIDPEDTGATLRPIIATLRRQLLTLSQALDTIGQAAGQARPSQLRTDIIKPIARATRARIDAQDAIKQLSDLYPEH